MNRRFYGCAVVLHGPNVDHMKEQTMTATPLERAIGLTVLDLAREQGVTQKEIQARTGIHDKTFRRHFTESIRHIPMEELELVAAALGMTASAVITLAEERLERSGN